MKLTKKKVLVAALAVCLAAIISMGTLAWFSDDDAVTNEFLIADSTDTDPEDIFSVDVWEKTPEANEDQDGAEYADILPGDKLLKEAHVKNTGHYDQYVRVTITISDAAAWLNAVGSNYDATQLFDGYDADMWAQSHTWNNLAGATETPAELKYVLYLKEVLPAGDDIVVFNNVLIPESLTKEQAAVFAGGFTVNVKAEAVQVAHTADGVAAEDAAWTAFRTVGL